MSVPSNTTAGTAIEILTLPYTNLQRVDDSGTTYTVWYRYTTAIGEASLGARAANYDLTINYVPQIDVYEDAGVTPYLNLVPVDTPFQMPVVTATTYYFKISSTTGNVSPALLQFSMYRGPRDPIPIGSILINDDTPGFPGVIVGADGSVINITKAFPAGEAGDALADGTIILNDFDTNSATVFDSQLNEIATLDLAHANPRIRTCVGAQVFYVGLSGNPNSTVKTITAAGAFGPTTKTLTAITSLLSIAASNDETILYHSAASINSPIHAWDLANDVALPDLAAAVATFWVPDILVLSDDSILASYINVVSGVFQVKRYDAAGATLNTYSLGTSTVPAGTLPRMAYATGATSFWVWTHPSSGASQFREVQVSDGTILQTINTVEFEQGVSVTGSGTFGVSFSCPLIVLREAISESNTDETLFVDDAGTVIYPDFTSTDEPIILDRVTPTLNSEQVRVRYPNLILEVQPGVGLTTGQGSNPLIMLRWSDDGGYTWSNEVTANLGAMGTYGTRAFFTRLGQARNRVFWLRVSDPVMVALLDAYIGPMRGTS